MPELWRGYEGRQTMKLYREKEELKNKAIVEKVKRILENTDFVNEATITIKIARSEITTIRYSIEEYLAPALEEVDNE